MNKATLQIQPQVMIENFRPPLIKLRAVHSKNPYIVQQHRPLLPEEKLKPQTLDGYLILKMSRTQLPQDVVTLDLTERNITKIEDENFQYFSNLIQINLSHNHLSFSQSFSKFENLEILNLQGNNISEINVDLSSFQKLKILNLSFNFLQNIESLLALAELKDLNLSDNFIKEVPQDLSDFFLLEQIDFSGNQLSSELKAADFFQALTTIQLLKYLYIARNAFKGFHTEKLKKGDFQNLEILDMSFNQVDNQHNLICVRNFSNLKKICITGNPFAIANETQGLQVEVLELIQLNQRNGAELENLPQQKQYLKKIHPPPKKIEFSNMVLLKNKIIKKNGKRYNLGVQLVDFKQKQTSDTKSEQQSFDEQDYQEENMFLTGTNDIVERKSKIRSSKSFSNYEQFKQQANEILGTNKEYEKPLQIKQQYKMLKHMIQKQNSIEDIYQNQKKYLKPTKASILQKQSNEILQKEQNIINHEKILNQKLQSLEKEINNSLDSIQ